MRTKLHARCDNVCAKCRQKCSKAENKMNANDMEFLSLKNWRVSNTLLIFIYFFVPFHFAFVFLFQDFSYPLKSILYIQTQTLFCCRRHRRHRCENCHAEWEPISWRENIKFRINFEKLNKHAIRIEENKNRYKKHVHLKNLALFIDTKHLCTSARLL